MLWLHDTTGGNSVQSSSFVPGTGWQQVTLNFTADNTNMMRIHLYFAAGSGTIYYDDVQVQMLNPVGDTSIATHKFTEDERDSESNLDHAQFRQYSSSLGRWIHPDPAGLAAVNPADPQSWNRYGYVIGDPLNLTDPSGLGPRRGHPRIPPRQGTNCTNSQTLISGSGPVTCNGFGGCFIDGAPSTCGVVLGIVGAGTGGSPLGFLKPTGFVPVEGTTWDGEPILSWVPVFGNWDLLQWNWDQVYLDRSGTIKMGTQKPDLEANQNCQADYLNHRYGPGAKPFVSHFSLFNTFSKEGGVTTLLLEGAKLTFGALAVRAGATAGEVSGVFLVPTGLGTAYDAEAQFVCRNVSGVQGHD